jgi:hypothetical protein
LPPHLATLGEAFLEPVSVGSSSSATAVSLLQLRPMTKWVALYLFMPRTIHDRPISRKPIVTGRIVFHVVNLRSPTTSTTR